MSDATSAREGVSRRDAIRLGMAAGAGALAGATLTGVAEAQQADQSGDVSATRMTLTMAGAMKIIEAGFAKAREQGTQMAIAVVDEGGNLKAYARMDGASHGTTEIVMRKARTSAAFRAATDVFGDRIQSGANPRYLSFMQLPDIWVGGGGVPVMRGGQVIGAVGAGGGTPEQDKEVAEAGIAALG